MSQQIDWEAGAKAHLTAQFTAAVEEIRRHEEQELEAKRLKEEAAEKARKLLEAAATLGFVIGNDIRKPQPNEPDKSRNDVPTAREVVLAALRDTSPRPLKAAQLRKIIEQKLGRSVHYKTPGMTLYRLADEGLVRRDGHSWFAVQKGQPGSDQVQQEMPIE